MSAHTLHVTAYITLDLQPHNRLIGAGQQHQPTCQAHALTYHQTEYNSSSGVADAAATAAGTITPTH